MGVEQGPREQRGVWHFRSRLVDSVLPVAGGGDCRPRAEAGARSRSFAGRRGNRGLVPGFARAALCGVSRENGPGDALADREPSRGAHRVSHRRSHHDDALDGDFRLDAGGRLCRRLHGRRPGLSPILRLDRPVRRFDDGPGTLEQLPADLRLLGRRGLVQLSSDRLLAHQAQGRRGGHEGVPGQPPWRLRLRGRDFLALVDRAQPRPELRKCAF